MARFWLNLGWDDCHFVHLLLRMNRHFGWGCKTKNSWRKHSYPTASMQAATTTMWELCVLGYLTYSAFFSSLAANYNWLGICHFFATNYACNAVPSRTLTTTYYCVPATHIWQILSNFFFKNLGKNKRESDNPNLNISEFQQ